MPRGADPVAHALREFLAGVARVGGDHQFEQAVLAGFRQGFHVALERRLERLLVLPFGMTRRERLHAVQRERELKVHRLFRPQGAVVIEYRDAVGGRDKVSRAFGRHAVDELDDSRLRSRVLPGGKQVVGKPDVRQGKRE